MAVLQARWDREPIANSLQTLEDSTTTPGSTYYGVAATGAATSAPAWRIRKVTDQANGFIFTRADGDDEMDNIWDTRASLSYF